MSRCGSRSCLKLAAAVRIVGPRRSPRAHQTAPAITPAGRSAPPSQHRLPSTTESGRLVPRDAPFGVRKALRAFRWLRHECSPHPGTRRATSATSGPIAKHKARTGPRFPPDSLRLQTRCRTDKPSATAYPERCITSVANRSSSRVRSLCRSRSSPRGRSRWARTPGWPVAGGRDRSRSRWS